MTRQLPAEPCILQQQASVLHTTGTSNAHDMQLGENRNSLCCPQAAYGAATGQKLSMQGAAALRKTEGTRITRIAQYRVIAETHTWLFQESRRAATGSCEALPAAGTRAVRMQSRCSPHL